MIPLRKPLLAAALALGPMTGTTSAGSLVEFPNGSGQASKLLGYLARPGLEGPYPAVVILHDCNGISAHSAGIADRISAWGYVALTVDSLGPRGLVSRCGGGGDEQAFDAYAALRYLAGLEIVDPERVAVLGQSLGAEAALYAIDRGLVEQYFVERFRAVIAYYPGCAGATAGTITVPALILIGEADDWSPAEACRQMVAHARPDEAEIALTVYPAAHHSFDVRGAAAARRLLSRALARIQ
jgi:dienelactone hydrolase